MSMTNNDRADHGTIYGGTVSLAKASENRQQRFALVRSVDRWLAQVLNSLARGFLSEY